MCGFLFVSKIEDHSEFYDSLESIKYRGPDETRIKTLSNGYTFGFHRLSIMDLSTNGGQPFIDEMKGSVLVCNGEVYNSVLLRDEFKDYAFKSSSDCEVITPLIISLGIEKACKRLDSEFAFVFYDQEKNQLMAGRDPMGIRPLFYGYLKSSGKIAFASEAKALKSLCSKIKPFPPGHYYVDGEIKPYLELGKIEDSKEKITAEKIKVGIREKLVSAVRKRLISDAPVGFLLSGGLDSSLVCSIAAKYSKAPIKTFSIGIKDGPIDTHYAKVVADYIKSEHHEVLFEKKDIFQCLRQLIYHLETFDITTIRASIGMYLVCQYVKEKTDIKVLLTGEVSDEIFGYKYTDFAPTPKAFQAEAQKRVKELYLYDVLRADRCISANSLEARVPFSDTEFIKFVMSLPAQLKMNTYGMGKYWLRKAFDEDEKWLPHEILFREKAAFSDAVGHSMVDYLKIHAEEMYTDLEFKEKSLKYKIARPISKEALMYREIFEEFFPHMSHLIGEFWMPNKEWENCDVSDPSARVLPNYGKSGS